MTNTLLTPTEKVKQKLPPCEAAVTDQQKRRIRAQFRALGADERVAELAILEITNAEWKGYRLGHGDGKAGKGALDARVEPGWE